MRLVICGLVEGGGAFGEGEGGATDDQIGAAGLQIHVVTGRPPATHRASKAWLREQEMPYDDLVFVDKYARSHPAQEGIQCLALDDLRRFSFSLGVDDSPQMAGFLSSTLAVPAVLFDRPWNASAALAGGAEGAGVVRCRGWKEVMNRFPHLVHPRSPSIP